MDSLERLKKAFKPFKSMQNAGIGYSVIQRHGEVDIAYPANEKEYCDLGGSAIMKVWAIADDKGELPIERAYFQLGNGTIESLSPIFVNHDGIVLWDKVTELKDDEHGIYYENVSFWLIPVILFCSSNGFIAIDFKGGRKDFRIKSGPWEIDNRITTGIEKHRKDEINVSVKDDCLKMFLEREFFNFS